MVNMCVPWVNSFDAKGIAKTISDIQDLNYAVAAQMIQTWNSGMSAMDPFEENDNVGSLNMWNELPEVRLPHAFIQAIRPFHDQAIRFLR